MRQTPRRVQEHASLCGQGQKHIKQSKLVHWWVSYKNENGPLAFEHRIAIVSAYLSSFLVYQCSLFQVRKNVLDVSYHVSQYQSIIGKSKKHQSPVVFKIAEIEYALFRAEYKPRGYYLEHFW